MKLYETAFKLFLCLLFHFVGLKKLAGMGSWHNQSPALCVLLVKQQTAE